MSFSDHCSWWPLSELWNRITHCFIYCRSDEKLACISICDRMGLKGYQVSVNMTLYIILKQPNLLSNYFPTMGLSSKEFPHRVALQIGKTKVFLRAGQMAELDARRTEVLANAARLIQRQIRTHLTRKEFITLRKATIHLQKLWRGYCFSLVIIICHFRSIWN